MPTIIRHVAGCAVAAVAVSLLAAGCGGAAAKPAAVATSQPTASPQPPTSSQTPSPTRTGPGPMTAAELAWLAAVKKMHSDVDSVLRRERHLTRTAMLSLSNTLGECRRVLRRIGPPTARLRPVLALVNKACAQFDKGAKCWVTAAHFYDSGWVTAGSPEERRWNQAIDCGGAGYRDGSNLLGDAEVKGVQIKLAAG